MERKIFTMYVGIMGIRTEDIIEYVHKISSKVIPATFDGEILVLPTQTLPSYELRIECINPAYVVEPELIKKHTELMKDLHTQLKIQLDLLKEKNNEEKN